MYVGFVFLDLSLTSNMFLLLAKFVSKEEIFSYRVISLVV